MGLLATARRPKLAGRGAARDEGASPKSRRTRRQVASGESYAHRADHTLPKRLLRLGSAAPDRAPRGRLHRWPVAARASVTARFPKLRRREDRSGLIDYPRLRFGLVWSNPARRRLALRDRPRGRRSEPGFLPRFLRQGSDTRPAFPAASHRRATGDQVRASRSKRAAHLAVGCLPRAEPSRGGEWRPKPDGPERERSWAASSRVLSVYNITSVLPFISTVKQ